MSRRCEICGKETVAGNSVPRKGQPRRKGGAGQHIGVKTKRVFIPNLLKVKTIIAGTTKTIKICTKCLKADLIDKKV